MSKTSAGNATSLKEAELLSVLMDHEKDAIYFKDPQSRFIRINRALATWYGLKDPKQAEGKSDADFFAPEFAKLTFDAEQEILRTGVPRIDIEEKLVWPDGRITWASATKVPLRDPAGKILGIFGLSRDTSAQLEAQKEIRQADALYRSLVDNLPQNFFRKDLEGKVVFANRQYCATLGKTLKELLGKTDHDLFPPELARKYREDDQRVLKTGVVLDTVEAHQPPGKGIIYVRVVKSPVLDSDRRAMGVQGIFWEVPASK
jgi:two-component system sensor histidine kinase/response regulator